MTSLPQESNDVRKTSIANIISGQQLKSSIVDTPSNIRNAQLASRTSSSINPAPSGLPASGAINNTTSTYQYQHQYYNAQHMQALYMNNGYNNNNTSTPNSQPQSQRYSYSSNPNFNFFTGGDHTTQQYPSYDSQYNADIPGSYPTNGNGPNMANSLPARKKLKKPSDPTTMQSQDLPSLPMNIQNLSSAISNVPSPQPLPLPSQPRTAISTPERPFACTHPGCTWSFARQSDLRRHTKSHAEPAFHCPYWRNDPTCHRNGGAFNRLDVLKRHLKLVHYVQDKNSNAADSKEDPGWCRACQKMFSASKLFVEHCLECAQNLTPTEWKSTEGRTLNPKAQTVLQNMAGGKESKPYLETPSHTKYQPAQSSRISDIQGEESNPNGPNDVVPHIYEPSTASSYPIVDGDENNNSILSAVLNDELVHKTRNTTLNLGENIKVSDIDSSLVSLGDDESSATKKDDNSDNDGNINKNVSLESTRLKKL